MSPTPAGRRSILRGATSALIALLIAVTVGNADEPKLTIGFIAPLSGGAAEHGAAARDGLLLGLKKRGTEQSIKAIFEDDVMEPAKTVAAFKKLTDLNKIDVIMAMGSGPCNAIAGLAQAKQIPFLALAGDTKVAMNRSHVIRIRPPAAEEGKALAALTAKRGMKRIAAVCAQNDFTSIVCDSFVKDAGSSIVFHEDVLPGDTDFQVLIPRLAASRPDAIALLVMPGKIGLLARQLRERNVGGALVGGAFFDSGADFEASRGALVGADYVAFAAKPDFIEEFNRTYPPTPSMSWAARFYDIAFILSDSLSQSEALLPFLKAVKDFDGALGRTRFVSDGGDSYLDHPFSEMTISATGPGQVTQSDVR